MLSSHCSCKFSADVPLWTHHLEILLDVRCKTEGKNQEHVTYKDLFYSNQGEYIPNKDQKDPY